MRALVTGAGLVGAHAARQLHIEEHDVALYDLAPSLDYLGTVLDLAAAQTYSGDIANVQQLAAIAAGRRVACIVHSAALIGARVSEQPLRGVEVNVSGTMAVAEAARLASVSRIVFCSSVAVYDLERLPEGAAITEDSPLGTKNLYGATKLAAEQLLTQYGKIYGIEVIHLRLAGIFGRGQYLGGSWMGRKLNRVLLAALGGQPDFLRPEWIGTQEYIYAKDAARAIARACTASASAAGTYNIGTGLLHSYRDVVAEIIRAIPGAGIRIEEGHEAIPNYLVRTQAFDTSKARTVLGFTPYFSFSQALADYIDELRRHSGKYQALE